MKTVSRKFSSGTFVVLLTILIMVIPAITLFAQNSPATNDFYDDAPTVKLTVPVLEIQGEITNPGKVDFTQLPLRSVIVKETHLNQGSIEFVGAYRYDGYSLFDILNNSKLAKKNETEFSPVIDLMVIIENDKGEKAVFSWGELYYPSNLHKIIIATQVTRIVPSKTKDLWPLPSESKIVAGTDLATERNLSNPVKITVMSYPRSLIMDRSKTFSPDITLLRGQEIVSTVDKFPSEPALLDYSTVFYGRGRGIHGVTTFEGIQLADILGFAKPATAEALRGGVLCIAGADGYRAVFSLSEVFNRNDFSEMMLIDARKGEDSDGFKLFASPDFFSDRAIKGIKTIALEQIDDLVKIKR